MESPKWVIAEIDIDKEKKQPKRSCQAGSGPNQPLQPVENHHFLLHLLFRGRHKQAESADIANMSWPIKCINMVLEFTVTAFLSDDLVGKYLFGGELEGIAILERHF